GEEGRRQARREEARGEKGRRQARREEARGEEGRRQARREEARGEEGRGEESPEARARQASDQTSHYLQRTDAGEGRGFDRVTVAPAHLRPGFAPRRRSRF